MFSLQRILGQDDAISQLLEASAREGCQSVANLQQLLADRTTKPSLETFAAARRKDKQLTTQISEQLMRCFVLAMEREDVEALATAIYRIPKTVEKFAERYLISEAHARGVDFSRQLALMERAVTTVLEMVQGLRAGITLAKIKQLNANMQKIESDADDVMLELIAVLFQPGYPTLRAVVVKDLFELNEKTVDRCRDAGNIITRVVLKNS